MPIVTLMLAATLHLTPPQQVVPQTPPQQPAEARLEDVVVEGRRLEDAARAFVGEVADPPGRRGLARWTDGVCVGVVNLQTDVAQSIVDRVSTIATDIGLKAGEPGCVANLLVIATADGQAMARELVRAKHRSFFIGASGTNHTLASLKAFQDVDRPVRWWQISLPVNSETGRIATRLPGYCAGSCSTTNDYAPTLAVFAASRIFTQIRDDMNKAIIIVDIDDVGEVDVKQLSDYVAMVGLAQIDPDAETTDYNSILNLFDPAVAPVGGLTAWDTAYLSGLYKADSTRISQGAQIDAVVAEIVRARRTSLEAGSD